MRPRFYVEIRGGHRVRGTSREIMVDILKVTMEPNWGYVSGLFQIALRDD